MAKIFEFPPGGKRRAESFDAGLHVDHFTDLVLFMTDLTTHDPQSLQKGNIDIRSKRINTASDEELYTWSNRSTRVDWKTHPSFYHALIQEIRRREFIQTP